MKFALAIFVRLNIFAFCVLLNLHEAEGLPPVMSRFLNRFVYRRGKGKRQAQRYKPAVFDDTYPADTEIVFRLANNYNVPSVDYSQIDFGTTYEVPPVENTYLRPPPAPISLHHYNNAPTHYSKPSSLNPTSSSYLPTAVDSRPLSTPASINHQTPSQFISSLREATRLNPPPPPSSSNSIFNTNSPAPPPSSINSILNTNLAPPPSSFNSILNINNPFSLPLSTFKGDLLPLIEIGKTPPPKYKVQDNFQQSFQVTLTSLGRNKKKRDLDTSEYKQQNTGYASENNNAYLPQNNYGTVNAGNAAVPGYLTNINPSTSTFGYLSQSSKPATGSYGYLTDTSKGTSTFGYLSHAPVNVRSKQGSIVTRNKIYFSPRLLAQRSQPLQLERRIPPEKPSVNVHTPKDMHVELITNISKIVDQTENDRPNNKVEDEKTYVAVRLQSYSVLRPPGNDSDLAEAQKDYGFGAHTFLFGNNDALLSVFEMLLRTDFDSKAGHPFGSSNTNGFGNPTLSPLEDTIDCIRNFANATERIHFWAHSRGEADAANLFQVFPRDPLVDAIPFIDTAPVTETLSATVF